MWNLASFYLEIVLVSVQDRCMVSARCTIGLQNRFGCTRWYLYITKLKWKLVSVYLEIMLMLTQDRCTVCVEHTTGTKIVLDTPDRTPM